MFATIKNIMQAVSKEIMKFLGKVISGTALLVFLIIFSLLVCLLIVCPLWYCATHFQSIYTFVSIGLILSAILGWITIKMVRFLKEVQFQQKNKGLFIILRLVNLFFPLLFLYNEYLFFRVKALFYVIPLFFLFLIVFSLAKYAEKRLYDKT